MSLEQLTIEQLVETNRRLNRRCSFLEGRVAKYRRRYVAVMNPAKWALVRANDYIDKLKEIHKTEYRLAWKHCFWCRNKWKFKHWVRNL